MRILVLGGSGMLGHKVAQVLSLRNPDTWCTLRGAPTAPQWLRVPLFQTGRVIGHFDAVDVDAAEDAIRKLRPDVVVNCIGVIKQRESGADRIASITVNALFPHRVARLVSAWGGRLIRISTDCVFSGERGDYAEDDFADARDVYGRTKFLGEVSDAGALTLRTSIVGRELQHHASLLEWFLGQPEGPIRGFTEAWWSGVTTNHLAELIWRILSEHKALTGVYHVSSGRISKFELLEIFRDVLRPGVEIVADDSVRCDRSLQGVRLRHAIGYRCPPLWEQIAQIAADPTPYEEWIQ